jgi:hypothetical protein
MTAPGRALLALSIAAATLAAQAGPRPDVTPSVVATRGPAPAPAPPAPLAEVQRVLDARVDAVARGDRDAFLATVDPAAPDAFRLAQASSFDGLRSLPLASFSLTARIDDTGDFGAGHSERYGGAPTFLPETRLRMRLADYDDRDDVQSLFLTFVRRGDRWYVGGDADLAPLGVDGYRGLWDQGPVEVQRTPHFLVLSHPPEAERARNLAAVAEEAISKLDERWAEAWSHRVPLILPASIDELARILQTTFDLDNFVAFVAYGSVRDRDWEPTAPRVYIQDRNLSRYGRGDQVRTLTHELDHVAVAPLAGPLIPSWVHEGVAEWTAVGDRTGDRRPDGSDGRLPLDFEFTVGGREAINLSYAESRSVVSFLAARWGATAPVELVRTLGAEKVAPGSEELRVDRALTRIAGLTTAQLEKEWAAR